MTPDFKYILVLTVILTFSANSYSQEKQFEQIALTQKTTINFPIDYKILRPRLEYPLWDKDYDTFYSYLTPALRKTQAALSYNNNGVVTSFTPNSIMPHAQLDTSTVVSNHANLLGTWRMLVFRSIRFNDSVYIPTSTYYRLSDTLLDDKSKDEAFAVFTDNNFSLYAREVGKTNFKKAISTKYSIENRRYIMLYKLFKSGAGISQFGLDEKGYLILNYPKVIENVKKGEYFSYYTIIDQYIFEKVK
jgi:hypothetical protein